MLIGLIGAALLAGLAGAWSPCGFSMVETIAPHGYAGRLRTTLFAAPAFGLGALAGGAATFGGLAVAGDALGLGGGLAVTIAVSVLFAAAAGDAAGRRILPQVRRQVPESWRRRAPVPVAAALYGVLLGLGFTTFVLSFATYALAVACLALADTSTGLLVGLAFGAGRTLPVLALAPLQGREAGARAAAAMAERPAILRSLRVGAAVALALAALPLALSGAPARAAAAELFTSAGADPSADGALVVWQGPTGEGLIARDGRTELLPGSEPALGGGHVTWIAGGEIVVARADTLEPVARLARPLAGDPTVSATHVAWRETEGGRRRILAAPLAAPESIALVAAVVAPTQIGRPSLGGARTVFHVAGTASSRIIEVDLASGARRTLRRATGALLSNPSLDGEALLHVRSSADHQQLVIGTRTGPAGDDEVLFSTLPTARRDSGAEPGRRRHGAGYPGGRPPRLPARPKQGGTLTLWSTALGPGSAYVTRLRAAGRGSATASILRVAR